MTRYHIDRFFRWLLPTLYRRVDLLEERSITPLIAQTADRLILVRDAKFIPERGGWIVSVRLLEKTGNSYQTIVVNELSEIEIRRAVK